MSEERQKRIVRILRWTGGTLAGLCIALALMLRTPPGHRLIEWTLAKATGGEVIVEGLDGALPANATARKIELRDAGGTWLRVTEAEIEWSPLTILSNHYEVMRVAAAKVAFLRRPLPSKPSQGASPRIDVYALSLPHIDIAPSLLGHRAMLAAKGSLNYTTIHEFGVDVAITRPGGNDHYILKGHVAADVIDGHAAIAESPDGLLGTVAGLPGLGPITLSADASGDRAANHIAFALTAGALTATGKGTISLAAGRTDLEFSAASSAMQLDASTGWASLAVDGHVHGAFDAPQVDATLHLTKLSLAGFTIAAADAQVRGEGGSADLTATAEGARLPDSKYAGVFAAKPFRLTAHADLKDPARPVTFQLRHALLALDGTAKTAGAQSATLDLSVPSLQPFAALAGTDLTGSARLKAAVARSGQQATIDLDGSIAANGMSLVARMLGRDATLKFHSLVSGSDVMDSRVRLHGAGFDANVEGGFRAGRLEYRVSTALNDLARLSPVLTGTAEIRGTVAGIPAQALLDLSGSADMASRGFARQRIALRARATGLPNPANARITADGRLDDAALALAADWTAKGPSSSVTGHDAKLSLNWKSLVSRAAITVPQKGPLAGHIALDAADLNDLATFTGLTMGGNLHATGDLSGQGGKQSVALRLNAGAVKLDSITLSAATLDGIIVDAFGTPRINARLNARDFAMAGVTGSATGALDGALDKLALSLTGDLKDTQGLPAHVTASVSANLPKSQVQLTQLAANWRGEDLALTAPANFDLAGGVAVDRLALKAAGGSIVAEGRLMPKLALAASVDAIHLASFRSFAPNLGAEGTLSARAQLTGTIAAPFGSVSLNGKDLRVAGYSRRLAAAALDAEARLNGATAQVNAKLSAGESVAMTLQGTAPLSPDQSLNLHAAGSADLTLLNPLLTAAGRQVKGRLILDGTVAGPMAAPRLSGTAALKGAEYQDAIQGLRIQDIAADLKADNGVIRIVKLDGKAGSGSIGGGGTVDTTAPGWPADLTIALHDARPIVSDMMTASLNGDLTLKGDALRALTLSGKLDVPKAEINIPDSFPPEVRTLNIRRRGQKPPPPPPATTALALDLAVATSGPVIVRGHGIDADLGGELSLKGSTGAPQVGGGFQMQRGTLTVAGQILNFTTGKVSFDGSGVRSRLDPTLDFVAETSSGGVTATLTVGGYASAPKITLSSSPQLPQDEILARLLFQQSSKQLTPLQMAGIAQALASLSGISNGFDPVASIRGGLGLDRLAVSGGSGVTTGTTVEAGKYVFRNIYVGAKQGLSGGTQAQVQIDITRNLKAEATINAAPNATATQGAGAQDMGGTLGLSYQFEY
ncbi:MAG: translocation/assembly module TamB domain-containing protein [Alphaproteobacteria bacterium]|nr:translocation/assembly module TamB domain-containing protein [Alphaproteobacteria bacterium]